MAARCRWPQTGEQDRSVDEAPAAADVITALGLEPHPEGGHYRETFRDSSRPGRAASTAILYLLQAGEVSHWHRVDAAEVWHWHAGAPLELSSTLKAEAYRRGWEQGCLEAGELCLRSSR